MTRGATVATVATLAALFALCAFVAALAAGSVTLGTARFFAALSGGGDETARAIVWELRAPRALAAFAAGALLALAGTVLQVLLRNPLADPYVLGVSGGASVGALALMLIGASAAWIPLGALAGAGTVAGLLTAFALRADRLGQFSIGFDPYRVLLAGVGFAAASGALVSLILTLAPAEQLPSMLFWLMGDLANASDSRLAWLVLIAGLGVVIASAGAIDLLALGAAKAASLGVAVTRTQRIALAVALAATAAAVLTAGGVGFIGLAVPQALRLAGVHRHRALAPLAALLGGGLLVAADTLARTVARPLELPVGAITALLGVPILLLLIARSR